MKETRAPERRVVRTLSFRKGLLRETTFLSKPKLTGCASFSGRVDIDPGGESVGLKFYLSGLLPYCSSSLRVFVKSLRSFIDWETI